MPDFTNSRNRTRILAYYSAVSTLRGARKVIVPIPPHPARRYMKSLLLAKEPGLADLERTSGYSIEALALMDEENLSRFSLPVHKAIEIQAYLFLTWNPRRLPSCRSCPYENFKCSWHEDKFWCRVLELSSSTHLSPLVYAKRYRERNNS